MLAGSFSRSMAIVSCIFLASIGGRTQAQFEPVVVVTASSIDKLLKKSEHLVSLAGFGQMAQMMQGTVGAFTTGLDKTRPVAITLLADEQSFRVFGMVPVTDLSAWLKMTPLGAGATDLGNDTYRIQLGPRPVVVKAENGWAYLAQSPEELEERPSDPLDLLDGLDQNYDFAVRGYIQNIPVGVRDTGLAQYRQMMQMATQRLENSDSAQANFQRANMERQMKSLERLADEVDQMTFGLLVDPETEKVIIESEMSAVRGSRMERQLTLLDKAQTSLSGFFVPKATMTMSMAYPVLSEDASEQIEMLESVREMLLAYADEESTMPSSAKEKMVTVVEDVMDIAKQAVESGSVDSAASAMIANGELNIVAAAQVPAGEKLQSIIERLAEAGEEMDVETDVRIGFGEHEGATFHAIRMALPDSKELSNAFGENLTLFLGSSDEHTYVGLGNKSLGALKKAITASKGPAKQVQPMRLLMSLGDIIDFVARVSGEDEAVELAETFREAGHEDQILVSYRPGSDGSGQTRIEIQEGIIASFGQAYAAKAGSQ